MHRTCQHWREERVKSADDEKQFAGFFGHGRTAGDFTALMESVATRLGRYNVQIGGLKGRSVPANSSVYAKH